MPRNPTDLSRPSYLLLSLRCSSSCWIQDSSLSASALFSKDSSGHRPQCTLWWPLGCCTMVEEQLCRSEILTQCVILQYHKALTLVSTLPLGRLSNALWRGLGNSTKFPSYLTETHLHIEAQDHPTSSFLKEMCEFNASNNPEFCGWFIICVVKPPIGIMLHICVNYKIGEHTEIQNGRIAADSPDFMKTKSSMEKSSSQ
jgi:hypothetical protein